MCLAVAKEKEGYLESAVEDFKKALENNPPEKECNEIKEQLEELEVRLEEKNIDSNNKKAEVFYSVGYKYFETEQYVKALRYFKKAVELNPNDSEYHYYCGLSKKEMSLYGNSIGDFTNAINIDPQAEYFYQRALANWYLENYDKAVEDCSIAVEKDPDEDIYAELLEDVKDRVDKFEKEENEDEENIHETIIPDAVTVCADDFIQQDRETNSIDKIKQKAEMYYSEAKEFFENGILEKALLKINKSIEFDNNNSEYYYLKAEILYKIGEHGSAQSELQKAINSDKENPKYYELRKKIENAINGNNSQNIIEENLLSLDKSSVYKSCEQNYIYDAEPDKSFLVNAGPGTGKTYTLIQKIKHLIDKTKDKDEENRIEEDNILVLSHTNAAVNEIKKRLEKISENTEDPEKKIKVYGINIRTICSFVKFAHSKIDKELNKEDKDKYVYKATEQGFIKANVELLERLGNNEISDKSLLELLDVKYFIVDEIQDATDSVGKIILELVKDCIDKNIPFALFGDECQAIFDYEKRGNKSDSHKMKSEKFYKKLKTIIKNKNVELVELEKNMRQQDGLEYLKEAIKEYRQAILSNNDEECEKCLQKIKDATPDNFDMNNINLSKDLTHCIITHSNNRALYIASKLQKAGIQVYIKLQDNKIQFEYHEWIGKVLHHKWDDMYITCEDFEEFIKQNYVNLPTNYKGYKDEFDKENHAKSFFEYLNTEIIGQSADKDISVNTLSDRIYYEYKCDSILKYENKCNVEVSTIHKAKGREFDFVHIDSGCCDGDYFEDKYKSMYVALTRPKQILDFVKFKMSDFDNSQRWANILKKELLYITENSKLKQYKVLYNDIDLKSFKDYQKDLSNVIKDAEIVLCKKSDGSWVITYNNKTIGHMGTSFINNWKGITKYGNPKKITGLRIDGIWSVFDKKENGDIIAWNVVSFCGFGDVEY